MMIFRPLSVNRSNILPPSRRVLVTAPSKTRGKLGLILTRAARSVKVREKGYDLTSSARSVFRFSLRRFKAIEAHSLTEKEAALYNRPPFNYQHNCHR